MEENKASSGIIEHRYFILDNEEKNKNHRTYTKTITDKWQEHEDLKSGKGIDIEYAVEEDAEIENEYLQDSLSCGRVMSLEYEGTKLFANVKFKKNELTKDLYAEGVSPEDFAVVPKGKGSVKNQKVQEDYELFGFNLVKADESSFAKEEEAKEAVN